MVLAAWSHLRHYAVELKGTAVAYDGGVSGMYRALVTHRVDRRLATCTHELNHNSSRSMGSAVAPFTRRFPCDALLLRRQLAQLGGLELAVYAIDPGSVLVSTQRGWEGKEVRILGRIGIWVCLLRLWRNGRLVCLSSSWHN